MSLLWCDKYRPKDFSKLDFHKEQGSGLKSLTKDGDFPHLLIYGPMGAGKKTRIMCILKELYGPGVERLRSETMSFTTPSNKKLEIGTVNSNYHIEVNPSDVGIYDRVVIMNIIKNVAQTQQLDITGQKSFKVVVLTDVDALTKDAQHALRRTMEKYISNCRLILCATSISRVIPAIRSRCLCVRIPAPSAEEIVDIIKKTAALEDVALPDKLAERIAVLSERNLRRALLMTEACKVESDGKLSPDQRISEPDWQIMIRETARLIVKEQSIAQLKKVREHLYELICRGIPSEIIFKTLLDELLQQCNLGLTAEILENAAHYEHQMVQGNKEIFHLEAFVAKCMYLYQNVLEEMKCDF
ncbi:replication factor C subunit 3 [Harmonia axyridis]|uniref:replication factor C subunit 3 n=1 Tax=Harmonia axyridis TaxID=115357 RepID=UPI001E2782FC|nr:replication factor C subunit 3 [Harmonia axyridis]